MAEIVAEYQTPEDVLDERAELLAVLFAAKGRRWRRRMAKRLAAAGDDWLDAVPSAAEWDELVESLMNHLVVSARLGQESVLDSLRAAGVEVSEADEAAAVAAVSVAVAAILSEIKSTGPRISETVAEAVTEAQATGATPRDVIRKLGFRGKAPGPLSDALVTEWGRTVGRSAVFAGVDSILSRFEGTKEWHCLFINSRHSHEEADGQVVATSDPFLIGGFPGRFPHDPRLPVGEVVNCRCYLTYKLASAAMSAPVEMPAAASIGDGAVTFAADAEQRRRGIMVSVEPTDEQRARFAELVPDHVAPEEMHVTLAYCGSVTDIDDRDDADRLYNGLRDAMTAVAEECGPLEGSITATTTLGDDDPPAQVGLVDSVGLGRLRALLVDRIGEECPDGFLRTDHDFLAHVTMRYSNDPLPDDVVGEPVRFERIYLHWGDDVEEMDLRGGPQASAEAGVHFEPMPYEVVSGAPGCDGYAVVKTGTDDVMGCHDTEGEAEAQRRALYANEEMTVTTTNKLTVAAEADPLDQLLADVPDDVADEIRAEIEETLSSVPERAATLDVIEGDDGEDEMVPANMPDEMDWQGPLVVEGQLSGDRRLIAPGALSWRDFPLPLMLQKANQPAHLDSVFAGNIWRIERMDDGTVWGYGTYDDSEDGAEARRLVDGRKMRGVSVDMDKAEGIVAALGELGLDDGEYDPDTPVEVYTKARIMGVTITPFPAFQEAWIGPVDENEALVASGARSEGRRIAATLAAEWADADDRSPGALVASAGIADPVAAPRAWFDEPAMVDGPEYLTVDDNGRISGLVCDWETAHIGLPDQYVTAPRNPDFSVFYGPRTYETAEGDQLRCGPLVMDTVHPSLKLNASDAQAFYAHTGCVVGAIRLYANRWGIAAAGTLLPGVTRDQLVRLRLADVSPDWRPVGRRGLTVCSVLAVPLSGFPAGALAASGGMAPVERLVPRAAFDAYGNVTAMVAVGAVRRKRPSVEDRLAALEVAHRRPRRDAALAKLGIESPEQARERRAAAAREALGI